MKKAFSLLTGILFFVGISAQDDWILKRDKDDVVIYTRESDDSPLKEYKATATINSPISEVVRFLTDLEYRSTWVVRCTGLKIMDTLKGGGFSIIPAMIFPGHWLTGIWL